LHMDANGESCYPGVRLVAEETAQTTDTVCGAIDELLQARFLRVAVAASGRRPCKYAARLDCVPPIRTQGGFSVPSSRTQTGDVASDSDDVASESAERCVRKDGTEGSRGNTGGGPAPTSARADDAAVEKRKRRARDEARNVGHHYPEADLRAKLHEDGFGCDEIKRNRRGGLPTYRRRHGVSAGAQETLRRFNSGAPERSDVLAAVLSPHALDALRELVRVEVEAELARREAEAPAEPESQFLTISEAAELLRCNRGRIDNLLSARRIPRVKEGARTLIRRVDVDAYLKTAENRREPCATGPERTAP